MKLSWPSIPIYLALALAACSPPPVPSDCGGMCEPAGPNYPGVGECVDGACTPTYLSCSSKDEITTCEDACADLGTTCAEDGCGGHTYRIYAGLEWCEDPERVGIGVAHACDEPVDWQFNAAVKCCCEQS